MKIRLIAVVALLFAFGSAQAAPINVSCTDTIQSLRQEANPDFSVTCPVNCAAASASIWGTDLYTTDSSICKAAIHAAVIRNNGGPVRVKTAPGQGAYTGSVRNGVTTNSWGSYRQSFKVMP